MPRPTRALALAMATALLVPIGASAAPATARPAPAGVVSSAAAAPGDSPLASPFYDYRGKRPLAKIAPGTILKTRTVPYSIQGLPLPITAIQLLYRTVDQLRRPTVNVTTIVRPLLPVSAAPKVISYQSFYDSLNPVDQPSAAIAGAMGIGDGIANIELALFAPALLAGYTLVIPDTEGQTADFAAGPEYGLTTLDSLRAASHSGAARIGQKAPIGLLGYSGGAIASEWATELAPDYAPDVDRRIVGTAIGGVLVHPGHNLHYIDGSQVWAGVAAMALVGIARGFDIDFDRYLSPYGRRVTAGLQKASIATVLGAYPGLRFKELVKKRYAVSESIPDLVRVANQLIMSANGTPSGPMFVAQGTGGTVEGTPGTKPGIGSGDGVMIAGDVRSMARRYCRRGVDVQYRQYPLSHVPTAAPWLAEAYPWLLDRFAGRTAPSSCGSIAKGNSLAPLTLVPAGR